MLSAETSPPRMNKPPLGNRNPLRSPLERTTPLMWKPEVRENLRKTVNAAIRVERDQAKTFGDEFLCKLMEGNY